MHGIETCTGSEVLLNQSENAKNRSIYCIMSVCMCAKAESCLRNICVYVVCELQHVRKDVAVLLCMCELQRVDDRVVIVSLFDCVRAQRMNKALLLLCWCWWDCSALLTSIACRRFVVSIFLLWFYLSLNCLCFAVYLLRSHLSEYLYFKSLLSKNWFSSYRFSSYWFTS